MERNILHIDCDCFYASVEMLYHPELRDKPMAVGGDEESRHGIILTKNQLAKKAGVVTGEALWQARQKCPGLITVPADYKKYQVMSQLCHEIYLDYTDQVEPFGLDECWLDITGSVGRSGKPVEIAKEIQQRVLKELGITVSIGVSFDKIYSKLGSDYKKPFGITNFTKQNYKETAWPLPVCDLLMVGKATTKKLMGKGVYTIGDLAAVDISILRSWLGKWGEMLYIFANALDPTPVATYDTTQVIKSIGNSTTAPRDLKNNDDVKVIIYVLAESVGRRIREQGFAGRVISISVRNNRLNSFSRQKKISRYTNITKEIAREAYTLFLDNYNWQNPIRSIGITVSDFEHDSTPTQTDMFVSEEKRQKYEILDKTVDWLKERYGNYSIQRGVVLADTALSHFNPHDDHTIHPVSFIK